MHAGCMHPAWSLHAGCMPGVDARRPGSTPGMQGVDPGHAGCMHPEKCILQKTTPGKCIRELTCQFTDAFSGMHFLKLRPPTGHTLSPYSSLAESAPSSLFYRPACFSTSTIFVMKWRMVATACVLNFIIYFYFIFKLNLFELWRRSFLH